MVTKLIEVMRISIPAAPPFDYPAAKADVEAALSQGYVVTVEGQDIVIRRPLDLEGRAA